MQADISFFRAIARRSKGEQHFAISTLADEVERLEKIEQVTQEAARVQLVQAMGMHPGTTWGEALEESKRRAEVDHQVRRAAARKELVLHLVVDTDGSMLGWACTPHGPEDAMAEAEAVIREVDLNEHDLSADWHEVHMAEVRALGVVDVRVQALSLEGLARAAVALVGCEGHTDVREWTERLQALRLNGGC